MVQGRMYISEAYLCFRANFFGWITDVSLPSSSLYGLLAIRSFFSFSLFFLLYVTVFFHHRHP